MALISLAFAPVLCRHFSHGRPRILSGRVQAGGSSRAGASRVPSVFMVGPVRFAVLDSATSPRMSFSNPVSASPGSVMLESGPWEWGWIIPDPARAKIPVPPS